MGHGIEAGSRARVAHGGQGGGLERWGALGLSKHKLPFLCWPMLATGDITWAASMKPLELGSPT